MKKQYMHPEMKEIKIQSQQIMAGSPILGGEYGGGNVLGREDNSIWEDINLQ